MSGFFESKSLKRTEFELQRRKRVEKRCFRHNGTMDLQACDSVRRDSMSLQPANNSMISSKISSGSVFIIMASCRISSHSDGESRKGGSSKFEFRALHPQLRHWQVRGNRDSVWGRRAGSHIIRLPRLLGEGPMGKPVAHPQDLLYLCTNAKLYGVGGWAKINIGVIGGNGTTQ